MLVVGGGLVVKGNAGAKGYKVVGLVLVGCGDGEGILGGGVGAWRIGG